MAQARPLPQRTYGDRAAAARQLALTRPVAVLPQSPPLPWPTLACIHGTSGGGPPPRLSRRCSRILRGPWERPPPAPLPWQLGPWTVQLGMGRSAWRRMVAARGARTAVRAAHHGGRAPMLRVRPTGLAWGRAAMMWPYFSSEYFRWLWCAPAAPCMHVCMMCPESGCEWPHACMCPLSCTRTPAAVTFCLLWMQEHSMCPTHAMHLGSTTDAADVVCERLDIASRCLLSHTPTEHPQALSV